MTIRHILFLSGILFLSACGGGSPGGYSWTPSAVSPPAAEAPRGLLGSQAEQQPSGDLTPPPISEESQPSVDAMAGGLFAQNNAMSSPVGQPALPPVKVALLVPLSGPNAPLGQAILNAAQLALFDLGSESFELLPRDTQDKPDMARQAAQSAIDEGAQLILGPLLSSSVRAVQSLAQSRNINLIAFSTDWSLAGRNTYILGFLPFNQVQRIAAYALEKGYRRIGIIAPDTPYGNAVVSAWNSYAGRTGVDVVRFRSDESQSELSERISRFSHYEERKASNNLAQSPYDAVLIATGGEQAKTIAELLSYYDLGPDVLPRLGTGLWDDPGLAAEPSLKGAHFSAPSADMRRDFERRYMEVYGQPPQRLATMGYDAAALAIVLARNGASSGRSVFDSSSLANPNGFAGVDGIFRFQSNGLAERGLAVLEFRNSGIEIVEPAPRTFQSYPSQ